ncbi:MAG TPA: KUP/HAK/KT family potassium transporter [Fredinandcohnia sp.]|nr:KUP/HAK/KT family potassium transporter [Fredinandcohnia sp.]
MGARTHASRSFLGALGVVFGDIGTSPLYAIREAFFGLHPVAPTRENVLGVLSLVVWSLTLIVSFKYLTFVLRANNRGEGGIFSLYALLGRRTSLLTLLALFGAALLYGDGIITPAISVLSALEGLGVATPSPSSRTMAFALSSPWGRSCSASPGRRPSSPTSATSAADPSAARGLPSSSRRSSSTTPVRRRS